MPPSGDDLPGDSQNFSDEEKRVQLCLSRLHVAIQVCLDSEIFYDLHFAFNNRITELPPCFSVIVSTTDHTKLEQIIVAYHTYVAYFTCHSLRTFSFLIIPPTPYAA